MKINTYQQLAAVMTQEETFTTPPKMYVQEEQDGTDNP
jgi:hypothetical protein